MNNENMNNEKLIKSFIEAKNTVLTREEKAGIHGFLLEVIRENPVLLEKEVVRKGLLARLQYQRPLFNLVFRPISLILLGVLSFGGISLATQDSLPGDFLYPLKVNVNEELEGLLTLNKEAKINFEAKRAARRLEEAEKLDSAGRLDEEIKYKIESDFEKHSDKVNKETRKRIEKSEKSLGVKAVSEARKKLEKAEEELKKGNLEIENGNFRKALLLFEKSTQAAKEARRSIKLKENSRSDSDEVNENNNRSFKNNKSHNDD